MDKQNIPGYAGFKSMTDRDYEILFPFTEDQKPLLNILYHLTVEIKLKFLENHHGIPTSPSKFEWLKQAQTIQSKHEEVIEGLSFLKKLEEGEELNYFIDWCQVSKHSIHGTDVNDAIYVVSTAKYSGIEKEDQNKYFRICITPKAKTKEGVLKLANQGVMPHKFVMTKSDKIEVWYLQNPNELDTTQNWVSSIPRGSKRAFEDWKDIWSEAQDLINDYSETETSRLFLSQPYWLENAFRNYIARFQCPVTLGTPMLFRTMDSKVMYVPEESTFYLYTEHSKLKAMFNMSSLTAREAEVVLAWLNCYLCECNRSLPDDKAVYQKELNGIDMYLHKSMDIIRDETVGVKVNSITKRVDISNEQYLRFVVFKDCPSIIVSLYSVDSNKPIEAVTLSKDSYANKVLPNMVKLAIDKVAVIEKFTYTDEEKIMRDIYFRLTDNNLRIDKDTGLMLRYSTDNQIFVEASESNKSKHSILLSEFKNLHKFDQDTTEKLRDWFFKSELDRIDSKLDGVMYEVETHKYGTLAEGSTIKNEYIQVQVVPKPTDDMYRKEGLRAVVSKGATVHQFVIVNDIEIWYLQKPSSTAVTDWVTNILS